ncbi:MAG: DNA-processing protein DprA [Kiritimatiellae bacterium]|nr:DNA-processing protein DprA [Kiritimatiellia bacterium]
MTEKEAYIAFNMIDHIGSVRLATLSETFGGVVNAWYGYPDKVARSGGEVDYVAELKRAEKYGVTILTPADDAYPKRLKDLSSHPLALYVKGDVSALSHCSLAMVGTRRASQYGLTTARSLASELVGAGWAIVSGLALGVDAESHRGALEANGITVGVLGSALDRFYPEENRDLARDIVKSGGAVVSQFPFGRYPDKETFPIRNEIIAALSEGTIAVECPIKSGTMITCNFAAEIGRTVMAFPGRATDKLSRGCNKLIREGATLVTGLDDVMEAMSELLPRKTITEDSSKEKIELPPYSLEESLIMRCLDDSGVSMEKLVDRSGLSAAKVNSLAIELRMKGRVKFLPGNRIASI